MAYGGGIAVLPGIVDQHDAGSIRQQQPGLFRRDLALGLHVNGFRVAEEHRHPDAGRIHPNGFVLQDLLGFPHHLHLFFGVAVVLELVDVRERVERDLLREDFRVNRLTVQQIGCLSRQFTDGARAGAGDRLIGRDVDADDLRDVVNRLERNHHLYGRAVRVGNYVARIGLIQAVRVHLGHHERDISLVSEL